MLSPAEKAILDAVRAGHTTATAVATEVGTDPASVSVLMAGLVGLKYLQKTGYAPGVRPTSPQQPAYGLHPAFAGVAEMTNPEGQNPNV